MDKTFQNLPFKQKLHYIWDYYTMPALVTCGILFVAGIFVYHYLFNAPKETVTGVTFFGDYIQDEKLDALSQALTERFSIDPENADAKVYTFYATDSDPAMDIAMGQRFFIMYQDKEFDLIVFDEFYRDQLINDGYLVSLDAFLSEDLLAEYEAQGLLYYSKTTEYPEPAPYAVSLAKSTYLNDRIGFDLAGKHVGLARTCPRRETALELLLLLLT